MHGIGTLISKDDTQQRRAIYWRGRRVCFLDGEAHSSNTSTDDAPRTARVAPACSPCIQGERSRETIECPFFLPLTALVAAGNERKMLKYYAARGLLLTRGLHSTLRLDISLEALSLAFSPVSSHHLDQPSRTTISINNSSRAQAWV